MKERTTIKQYTQRKQLDFLQKILETRNITLMGNSMSSHSIFLDVDTLTSQILFIFSLFIDNVEMIKSLKISALNSWGFQS